MKRATSWMSGQSDVAIVLAVMGILLVLFVPIPRGLLDFLVLANFSFALLVLLLTFVTQRPVEFSTFPSLLLLATLFRLALNVAATRLILADGDAGRVIAAVGAFVVGGQVVVGLVVFAILVVVQFVVVTSGAQRVSEVAARFTLDSLPGQQMSIDADLNMGFIDQQEAQRRRRALEREAAFYGAMDGASKFVKGDAVAGLVVLCINIFAGLVIGVLQHKMSWGQALQTYALLTVGDGIVTQVPALVIAVATGIIVTRSGADESLGRQVLRQVTASPKTQLLVALALAALLVLPGIPAVPVLLLLAGWSLLAWTTSRSSTRDAVDPAAAAPVLAEPAQDDLTVHPVEIQVGAGWAPLVAEESGLFIERVNVLRKQIARETGFILPKIRFRTGHELAPDAYEILVEGVVVARGQARRDKLLAIHPAGDQRAVPGQPTNDPTYGLPALWVDADAREAAAQANYTLVDAPTVFLTHVGEVLRRESPDLLSRTATEAVLARVRQSNPALVEECIPVVLTLGDVQKVLQNLLREKVSIRHIEAILETLADAGRATKDVARLTEAVRQRLAASICQSLTMNSGTLHVLTLDPVLESRFLESMQGAAAAQPVAIEPRLLETFLQQLMQQADRMMKSNLLPVLLCSPDLRRHVRLLAERGLPHLRVLSLNEIPRGLELKAFGTVNV